MSKTLDQIFIANPAASLVSTDLIYLSRSPYTPGNDYAITAANFESSVVTANGKVNAGTINDLAYYAASGNTVSGLATANRGFLITGTTGIPSISNTITLVEDQSTNTTAGTPTLLMTNSTGITYPASANFGVTVGDYVNALLTTSQTINSSTPGGSNFVYGSRLMLTYDGSGTNDLSALFLTGRELDFNWTSTNTVKQLVGVSSTITYSGSNQGGRVTSSLNTNSSTLRIQSPASSTVTITNCNGSTIVSSITNQTNTGITQSITTHNGISCTNTFTSAAASNTTSVTNLAGYNYITTLSAAGSGSTLAITNLYGLRLQAPTVGANTTITNRYGVSSEDASAQNVFAGIIVPSQTLGIQGTTTNNNANAGSVGEYASSSNQTPQALTSPGALNITSISLTAGDWDVYGVSQYIPGGGAVTQFASLWISSVSATDPADGREALAGTDAGAYGYGLTAYPTRFSLSTTTTIYLSTFAIFSVGTLSVVGIISARRRR